jgi:hypothetical protein
MSAVFNLLLGQLGQAKKYFPRRSVHKYFPPSAYQTDKTFTKTVKSYLPPDYYDRAAKISNKTKIDFVKTWSFNASKLTKAFYPTGTDENVLYFMGRQHEPFLAGMSSITSEVYRSAYLATLHIFYSSGLIDDFTYYENSFAAMPIDFSYWKITPSRAPDWWPIIETTPSSTAGIVNISYEKNVERIIDNADGYRIIALSGPMKPTEGWANEVNNTLVLTAFFYRVTGADIPSAIEVGGEVLYSSYVKLNWTKTDKPFDFLGSYNHYFFQAEPMTVKDLVVYPIVAVNHKTVSGIWQWLKLPPDFKFTSRQIAIPLKIQMTKPSFFQRTGQKV